MGTFDNTHTNMSMGSKQVEIGRYGLKLCANESYSHDKAIGTTFDSLLLDDLGAGGLSRAHIR